MPAVFLAWGYHAWQPYFLQLLGMTDVRVLGFVAAAVSLAMAGGSWLVERLTRACRRRTTLLLGASIIYAASTVGVGLTASFPIAVVLYLLGSAASGVFTPVNQAYLHAVIPTGQRATVLSLNSLVASAGSMGGQAGLGWLAASRSLGAGYLAGGVVAALAIPWVLMMRRLGGQPDQIRGTSARFAACESRAIPSASDVLRTREA
jgi:predicted MFS family arabinose efflux permease